VIVFAWAAWISVLTTVLVVWEPDDEIQWLPFAGASAAIWAVGLVFYVRRRLRTEERMLPDLSPAPFVLALGFATMLGAPALGHWLLLLGGGIVLVGVVVIAREVLAERRFRE
jgi:O-antigen/teichoic acid export membrane protein